MNLLKKIKKSLPAFFLVCSFSVFAEPKLDLLKVLESVEQHYPQVKIASLEVAKAQGAYLNAKGKFDPLMNADTQSLPVGGYISNYGNTQFTVPTLYNGLKLFAGYRNGNGDWPIYYQNYLTNSKGEYRTGLSLPLLKDRLIDKERADLMTSEESVMMKQHEAEAIKIKIYQEAISVYWQWVEAGLQLETFQDLLALSQTRQHAIEQQAQAGDIARLAISENLQQMTQREQLVNQGHMIFEQASIQLSLYYRDAEGKPRVPSRHQLPFNLAKMPHTHVKKMPVLSAHPAIKKLSNYSKIVKIKRDLAENQLMPQLDAAASTFKQYGTGGYPLLIPQAAMVGVSFKFPIFQREAKGNLIQAQSELDQIISEKKFLYDQLRNDLSKMLVGIQRGGRQLLLLEKELSLAKKVQAGETKKFYEGDSTLFLVNQREQMTTQVQLNTLHMQVELASLKDKIKFFSSARIH
jgi:outer membrane protein TolC